MCVVVGGGGGGIFGKKGVKLHRYVYCSTIAGDPRSPVLTLVGFPGVLHVCPLAYFKVWFYG